MQLSLQQEIDQKKAAAALRVLPDYASAGGLYTEHKGRRLLSFASNDYLGLSQDAKVINFSKEILEKEGLGPGSSRLLSGNNGCYQMLENTLSTVKKTEKALVFGSGYMANIGVLSALMKKGDLIVADRLVHASLIDGARLSGAKLARFTHNDVEHCQRLLTQHRSEARRALVVVDHVYSMDGDLAPLKELSKVAKAHDAWLLCDDAHGLGVIPDSQTHLADIQTGNLSKACGAYGGYVCASALVIEYLISHARSLIYSTSLPPALLTGAQKALEIMQQQPELVAKPLALSRYFASLVGLKLPDSPIISVVLGANERALEVSLALAEAGFHVPAIRPPTVPENTARLRLSFTARHSKKDIATLAQTIKELL